MRRYGGLSVEGSGLVLVLVALAACGGGQTQPGSDASSSPPPDAPSLSPDARLSPDAPVVPHVLRVEIQPASGLLNGAGAELQLSARAYGADGSVLQVPIAWSSSKPEVVRIDAGGKATAIASRGSAQIVASAEGVGSTPLLVLVAKPAAGAVLIRDDQVVGEPVGLDPEESYGLGWKYRVTLTGVPAPAVGAILMTTGVLPVGGRVVAVSPAGERLDVTLELVSAAALFDDLVIKESIALGAGVPATAAKPAGARPWAVGPFECESAVETSLITVEIPAFTLDPDLMLDIDYDRSDPAGTRMRELSIHGSVEGEIKASIKLNLGAAAKVTCEAEIITVPLPFNGPLAALFGANVPLSVGAELQLSVNLLTLIGAEITGTSKASFELGFRCPVAGADCEMINTFSAAASGEVAPVWPSLDEQLRLTLTGFPYIKAKLAFGVPFLKRLRFEAFELKAGVKGTIDYAPMSTQAADTGYHSTCNLSISGQAEAASSVEKLKKLFEIKFLDLVATVDIPVDGLPEGTFTVAPAAVAPGEKATFTVTLEQVAALGMTVTEVDIYRLNGTALQQVCAIVPTASGQKTFSCQASFTAQDRGTLTFYAFAHAEDALSALDLEVADDAVAHLQVRDPPGQPVVLGSVAFASQARGIDVMGTTAYVMLDQLGLATVDVSQDAAPAILKVADVSPHSTGRGVVVTPEKYAMAGVGSFKIVRVTDPRAPVVMSAVGFNANCGKLVTRGTWAFVACGTKSYVREGMLGIADIANPSDTTINRGVASITWSSTVADAALSEDGATAFLLGSSGSVASFNVADPRKPVQTPLHTLSGESVTSFALDREGNRLYVAAGDLSIVDVSNPRALVRLGHDPYRDVRDVDAVGSTLVAVGVVGSTGRVWIYDVSVPAAPTVTRALELAAPAIAVKVVGSRAYVTTATGAGAGALLVIGF